MVKELSRSSLTTFQVSNKHSIIQSKHHIPARLAAPQNKMISLAGQESASLQPMTSSLRSRSELRLKWLCNLAVFVFFELLYDIPTKLKLSPFISRRKAHLDIHHQVTSIAITIMRLFSPLVLSLAMAGTHAAGGLQDEKKKELLDPCTIASTTSGTFYDLRSLSVLPEDDKKKKKKGSDAKKTPGSWHSKGYDYSSNFTLNICAPVVEEIDHVVGVEKNLWRNVSAYYEYDDEIYSMG